MAKEFREFALKGNVLDLAVGVVIGAAFGAIVNSMVSDIIMPLVGMAGNVNFKDKYIPLSDTAKQAVAAWPAAHDGAPMPLVEAQKAGSVLAYGNFITFLINFLIVAFVLFMVIKLFNAARRRFEAQPVPAPAVTPRNEVLLAEIRDLLARR